jgi:hypothetical protein
VPVSAKGLAITVNTERSELLEGTGTQRRATRPAVEPEHKRLGGGLVGGFDEVVEESAAMLLTHLDVAGVLVEPSKLTSGGWPGSATILSASLVPVGGLEHFVGRCLKLLSGSAHVWGSLVSVWALDLMKVLSTSCCRRVEALVRDAPSRITSTTTLDLMKVLIVI